MTKSRLQRPKVHPLPDTGHLVLPRGTISGRYEFGGGFTPRALRTSPSAGRARIPGVRTDLAADVDLGPVDPPQPVRPLRFTLHVDVDGEHPLHVISGRVEGGGVLAGPPAFFVGRTFESSEQADGLLFQLSHEPFTWPATGQQIVTIFATFQGNDALGHSVKLVLRATDGADPGPFVAVRVDTAFREVEMDVDLEDEAVAADPYASHEHPVRPPDLPLELLTLERGWAKAGVRVSRLGDGDARIASSEAGVFRRWTDEELHDSMELHWEAYADVPQWRMWVFLAEHYRGADVSGVMFDFGIDADGGLDRQGTAVFTRQRDAFSPKGRYADVNPPAEASVRRELFFTLMHETGHAFNLFHSFDKQGSDPGFTKWATPDVDPVTTDPFALSFMNYPTMYPVDPVDYSTKEFYSRFRFEFSDPELLFVRHAPEELVEMGNAASGESHAMTTDPGGPLALELKPARPQLELGEPVLATLVVRNRSDRPVPIARLDPSSGFVRVAVVGPDGLRRAFVPIARTCGAPAKQALGAGGQLTHEVRLSLGKGGFHFKDPGPYRIEATCSGPGGAAAASAVVRVLPPRSAEDAAVVPALWNARIGRALAFGGSRVMPDVDEVLDWAIGRLGASHPVAQHLVVARALPFSRPRKVVDPALRRVRRVEAEPERVLQLARPLVDRIDAAVPVLGAAGALEILEAHARAARAVGSPERARRGWTELLGALRARSDHADVRTRAERLRNELGGSGH